LPHLEERLANQRIYPISQTKSSQLNIFAFGPCDALKAENVESLDEFLAVDGTSDFPQNDENELAIPLHLMLWESEIMLCSDFESKNWNKLLEPKKKIRKFPPCPIKVSHHGSETGRTDKM
jgi:hypothetical protein